MGSDTDPPTSGADSTQVDTGDRPIEPSDGPTGDLQTASTHGTLIGASSKQTAPLAFELPQTQSSAEATSAQSVTHEPPPVTRAHRSRHSQHSTPTIPGHRDQRNIPDAPSMMHQHLPPYVGVPSMNLSGPGYYMPQHGNPVSYYMSGDGRHPQTQQNMFTQSSRPFFPGQNQGQNAPLQPYYYPTSPLYPPQPQHYASNLMHPSYIQGGPANMSIPQGFNPLEIRTRNFPTARGHDTVGDFTQVLQAGVQSAAEGADSQRNMVRGPPRKPKQSGHAVWIGNLPPQTELMDLVRHVCKEAPGVISLFLIAKSNCAFANFKDESACIAAQLKLHESKFRSIRLVSRMRKSNSEASSQVTSQSPEPSQSSSTVTESTRIPQSSEEGVSGGRATADSDTAITTMAAAGQEKRGKEDRFFVLKSLTTEDLELSTRTGMWATQSHNEETLNNAFQTADNVYLIFSTNKSGEYFGYARMTSIANDDPAAAIEFAPKVPPRADSNFPTAIIVEATDVVPRGRIVEDASRGTIFWEAISSEDETNSDDEADAGSDKSVAEDDVTQAWGKPFEVEWLSTVRLPFYRTRGLRNSWNSNREVKIARDGTELEPSVGRKLIGLFNKLRNPIQGSQSATEGPRSPESPATPNPRQ